MTVLETGTKYGYLYWQLYHGNTREQNGLTTTLALPAVLYRCHVQTHRCGVDSEYHNHVASVKKLKKGDACLCTWKIILGWILDCLAHTLELPPHWLERLQQIFDDLCNHMCVRVSKWQKVLGELQCIAIGIPGSWGAVQPAARRTQVKRPEPNMHYHWYVRSVSWLWVPQEGTRVLADKLIQTGPWSPCGNGSAWCLRGWNGVWLPVITNSNIEKQVSRSNLKQPSVLWKPLWHHYQLGPGAGRRHCTPRYPTTRSQLCRPNYHPIHGQYIHLGLATQMLNINEWTCCLPTIDRQCTMHYVWTM